MKILSYEEFLNESAKFTDPTLENETITELVADTYIAKNITPLDIETKSPNYTKLLKDIEKVVERKELKRIELIYNAFDRYILDMLTAFTNNRSKKGGLRIDRYDNQN